MYYSKFTISNFKGISNLTLDLEKQPKNKVFTLVGLNESGKTTILEALSLLNTTETPDNVHDFIPKSLRLNFNDNVTITAFLKLEEYDKEIVTEVIKKKGYKDVIIPDDLMIFKRFDYINSENKPNDYLKLIYSFKIKGKKGKSKKVVDITYKSDPECHNLVEKILRDTLIPPILYYPNFLFDFPEKIYLKKQVGETDEQPLYREVISDILNSIDSQLNIEKHLLDRLTNGKTDAKRALDSTLLKMNAKVTKVVFSAWDALFDSKGKEIVITASSDDDDEYYLEFNLKEHSNYFQISERSLGFRWFFTFLLFTEFRKNRSTKKGEILFMLDEPASNLHSTAQKKLLDTFEAILTKAKLIYTTHSHHLINPKWLSGAYIVRNKSMDYESDFDYDGENADIEIMQYKNFVAKHPNQKSFFQPILDTLDYQPGLLEEVPGIIITEGKNDFYIFKYFINILGKEIYKNINIYPGGGANKNTQTISLYIGWAKPYLIFLDSDKGGLSAKSTYLKELGPIVEPFIVSYENVDETMKNMAVEDLFTNEEKLYITQIYDTKLTAYKKSAFNTAIENLFITNADYKFSNTTLNNFKLILDYLLKKSKELF